MKELLQKLQIDENLTPEQLLDALQTKNLEFLERMDSCTDKNRLKQLQETQQAIETEITRLSTGITLERRIADRNEPDGEASCSSKPQLEEALGYYKSGSYEQALPILMELAQTGDVLSCTLAANLLTQSGDLEGAKRVLFFGAQQGDGTTCLMLAQLYAQTGNPVGAQDWAKKAFDQKIHGSSKLLAQLARQGEQRKLSCDYLIQEILWAKGYDRHALILELPTYFRFLCLEMPHEDVITYTKESLVKLNGIPKACAAVEPFIESSKRAIESVHNRKEYAQKMRYQKILRAFLLSPILVALFFALGLSYWEKSDGFFMPLYVMGLCVLLPWALITLFRGHYHMQLKDVGLVLFNLFIWAAFLGFLFGLVLDATTGAVLIFGAISWALAGYVSWVN